MSGFKVNGFGLLMRETGAGLLQLGYRALRGIQYTWPWATGFAGLHRAQGIYNVQGRKGIAW